MNSDPSFQNKTAVITGAGSGIGRALALALARAGARLALTDWNAETLAETVALARAEGAEAEGWKHDVSQKTAIAEFEAAVRDRFGPADILVNNAGVSIHRANFTDIPPDDFEMMMNVNLWGVIHCTRAFLPGMLEKGSGHIANVSSIYAMLGVSQRIAYCTAKFAVRGFTETLRQELLGSGIGVTSVLPGGVRTNITKHSKGWPDEEKQARAAAVAAKTSMTSPEKAARQILRGIRRNKARVLIGPDAWLLDRIARWMPGMYHRLVKFFLTRMENRMMDG